MRVWLAILLSGGLVAGDGESAVPPLIVPIEPVVPVVPVEPVVPVVATPPVPLLAFSASGGTRISMSPNRPSEALGVRLRYEAVRLECDRLSYLLSNLAQEAAPQVEVTKPGAVKPGAVKPSPAKPVSVLAQADISGGPDGRVIFDTTNSQLPQMAFRGLLRPTAVTVRRLDQDPARPREVRFRAEAANLGDLSGNMMTAAGPRLHVAWADRSVIEFVAQPDGSALGLGTPRLTVIHFYGQAAAEGRPARPAVLLRLRQAVPAEEATVARQLGTATVGMRASGMTMSLYFDEAGSLSGYENDTGDYEVTDGEDLVPRRSGSLPTFGK